MSGNDDTDRYEVIATYKGQRVNFTVDAPSGAKATSEARQMAKIQGMNRIFVNLVRVVDQDQIDFEPVGTAFLERRRIPADRIMSFDEIESEILFFLGDDMTLKVIQDDGVLLLDDGPNGQVNVQDITALELTGLLFDWAVFVGLTSLSFADYLGDIEYWMENPPQQVQ